MKRIIALTLMLMMFVSTVCFAAVSSSGSKSSSSGSKSSSSSSSGSKSSTPPSSSTSGSSTPSVNKTTPSNNGEYKPSAAPNSYSEKAPAKQVAPNTNTTNTTQQSTGSSFWRNASMFGGGMLAGSLLGNLFGGSGNNMGNGGGSFFGLLLNLLMIGGMVMGARYLWNKFKQKNNDRR